MPGSVVWEVLGLIDDRRWLATHTHRKTRVVLPNCTGNMEQNHIK